MDFTTVPDLNCIQANILKSHGRDFSACIFITFDENEKVQTTKRRLIKSWISNLNISSAYEQSIQTIEYIENRKRKGFVDRSVIQCFYLSSSGLKHLFPDGVKSPSGYPKDFDNYSMKWDNTNRRYTNLLNDPETEKWECNYKKSIDAMYLIASSNEEILYKLVHEIKEVLDGMDLESFIELGKRLYYQVEEEKMYIEPFGFRDGLSQPQFLKKNKFNKDVLIDSRWRIVLDNKWGSFLVFRKLEQDVPAFHKKVKSLASKLKISIEYAEAQIIGRFKDGTPLTLFESSTNLTRDDLSQIKKFNDFDLDRPDKENNIDYSDDPKGLKCPFHAHIRKTNPRNNRLKDAYVDKTLNIGIARRGIPYDNKNGEVGLLFMSFQRGISQQFHTIQENWANDPKFSTLPEDPKNGNVYGLDPIIGQIEDGKTFPPQRWNTKWGCDESQKIQFDFSDVVNFRGGEYFYAPNILFLKSMIDFEIVYT